MTRKVKWQNIQAYYLDLLIITPSYKAPYIISVKRTFWSHIIARYETFEPEHTFNFSKEFLHFPLTASTMYVNLQNMSL